MYREINNDKIFKNKWKSKKLIPHKKHRNKKRPTVDFSETVILKRYKRYKYIYTSDRQDTKI